MEEEIYKALCSLTGDKSPGPDGLQMEVYKARWHVMKTKILAVFKEFQDTGYLDWRLNTTFITLVPKLEGEKEIFDFRPISLLSGVYKLIGKTLALRLKSALNGFISKFQCGGLPDRHLHEGVLIANELIDSWIKNGKPGLICKLDFTKTFDTVSWEFIEKLLFRKVRF